MVPFLGYEPLLEKAVESTVTHESHEHQRIRHHSTHSTGANIVLMAFFSVSFMLFILVPSKGWGLLIPEKRYRSARSERPEKALPRGRKTIAPLDRACEGVYRARPRACFKYIYYILTGTAYGWPLQGPRGTQRARSQQGAQQAVGCAGY